MHSKANFRRIFMSKTAIKKLKKILVNVVIWIGFNVACASVVNFVPLNDASVK